MLIQIIIYTICCECLVLLLLLIPKKKSSKDADENHSKILFHTKQHATYPTAAAVRKAAEICVRGRRKERIQSIH